MEYFEQFNLLHWSVLVTSLCVVHFEILFKIHSLSTIPSDRGDRFTHSIIASTDTFFGLTIVCGAFYFFVKSPVADETEFVKELADACILAVPGRGFGCPGYIRLTFCVGEKVIAASADSFKKVMAKYR